ncbi:O-antigen ligase family protein [Neorhizobium alkalisoli]|uniref:Exopolysaccharide production protein ExoQ n=1 Tax=Neorhizobium alkalisoli TaxID=528178 RepID=A0A561QPG3_9HYPH|nr:O-antigen ligase [Neorhizobium alkalisoli]TWF52247.1 exopolysaccharide production protein ExoQ [Neorhizobium alkalisoli]
MRIAKSALIDQDRNELYGIAAIALSFFVFAYSSRFGQISILAYYGVWFLLVAADYKKALGSYSRYFWIFTFATFCFVSSFWAPAFGISLRTAIQYLTHVICALIAMRTVSVRTLTRGGVVGVALVLVYSILFGTYTFDSIDGSFGFVGAFSSKNQLGFYASLGILFSYATVMVFGARRLWLAAAGVNALLSAYCLAAAQSATSVITTIGIVAICMGMQAFMFFSPKNRRGIFAAALILGFAAVVAALQSGGIDVILGLFGKDSTLTGRTYLWQNGIEAAARNPMLGIGYQSFWVVGFPDAERLWDDFGITGRSGFHFHNTYIETTVETGFIGLLLLVSILLTTFIGHLKRLLTFGYTPDSLLLFSVACLLMIRSFVEIDILNPYHVGSFLFYFAAGKLTARQKSTAQPRAKHFGPNQIVQSQRSVQMG